MLFRSECAIKFGLAVNAKIAPRSIFARKNYFYPDLPKGYQISQYELPVVAGGEVKIMVAGVEKTVQLTRAHLEEDAGKSLHEGLETSGVSGIDLNRAGTPLLEIVTEPCMASAEEAVAYAKALHGIVTWIGICDGNMQEGSFRCDANVSVRRAGEKKLGTRAEIKNVNSFRFLERAIQYEIRRQIELLEDGGKVVQETRLYDSDRNETRPMRSKEDAMDYRYFPDPDLLPLEISEKWITEVKSKMSELPTDAALRISSRDGLTLLEGKLLVQSRAFLRYYEDVSHLSGSAKATANWVLGEISAFLNRKQIDIDDAEVPSRILLAGIIGEEQHGNISTQTAKDLYRQLCDQTNVDLLRLASVVDRDEVIRELAAFVDSNGLRMISDSTIIEKMVDDVVTANPKSVEEYKAGKEKAFNALFGQVMKASNKTANPAQVTEILKKKLS